MIAYLMNNEEGTQRLPCEDRGEGRQEVAPEDHARATGKDAGGKKTLTQERLKGLLHYDPETGVFRWKVSRGSAKARTVAGYVNEQGYLRMVIDRKWYLAHRLAWFYTHGVWPEFDIDHRNHITTDNRIVNLREATRSENCTNQVRAKSNNKSGFLGVSKHKHTGYWCASIQLKGKRAGVIGYFNTPEEAHAAYLNAKRKLHDFNTL